MADIFYSQIYNRQKKYNINMSRMEMWNLLENVMISSKSNLLIKYAIIDAYLSQEFSWIN